MFGNLRYLAVFGIGALAAFAGQVTTATPSAAQLLSECYYDDGFGNLYIEPDCAGSASGVGAAAQGVANSAAAFIQQQLNFQTGFTMAVAPTGRLRHTFHDGMTATSAGTSVKTDDFEVEEGSVFANGTYDLPGTVMGGKVRIALLAGYDNIRITSELVGVGAKSKTEVDSFFYGGSYIWSKGSLYTMSLLIGLNGDLEFNGVGGRFSHDISGYISNSVIGNTFDLGLFKFDLRGALASSRVDGDTFTNQAGNDTKAEMESFSGSLTGTIFTIVNLDGGIVLRPYGAATYKHNFEDEIKLIGEDVVLTQADDFGKVELGFDMVQGIFTFGAAAYTEWSVDEETFGARFGASVKLQ